MFVKFAMMKLVLAIVLFIGSINAVPHEASFQSELDQAWEDYKIEYGKKYEALFEIVKRYIWENNVNYIQHHNLEYGLGKHTYTLGINQFTDMTSEEFKMKYLSDLIPTRSSNGIPYTTTENAASLPPNVDWRQKGYVTTVKDQGQCGSCWSFSSTGSLEGQYFRKTGNLISFSEQQLVDCTKSFNNSGCNGGWMDNAFKYVAQYGIESEWDYRYTAQEGTCKYNLQKVITKSRGIRDIPSESELLLAAAVANEGPVAVVIDASQPSFRFYKSGIYNEVKCQTHNFVHAVLAVGYGSENGKNYWLVKNSWGAFWGMTGYIMMSKDANNQCGIATKASFPII